MSTLVNSTSHALTLSKHHTFSFFEWSGLSAITKCVFLFAAKNFTLHNGDGDKGKLFPQPLTALVTYFLVTVSHSWGLTNYLWPGLTPNCLPHDIILLPVSSGLPKNYLSRAPLPSLTQIRPYLTPATLACLTLHPIILHNIPKPFYEGFSSKAR